MLYVYRVNEVGGDLIVMVFVLFIIFFKLVGLDVYEFDFMILNLLFLYVSFLS